jgi:11beta/17beta-hydroxysteroid dehydrogenase
VPGPAEMAKEAVVNAFLSCFMHVGLALVLLVYLPLAFVCRLVARPFARREDLRGKVVLVTGASSGIGEVTHSSQRCPAMSSLP